MKRINLTIRILSLLVAWIAITGLTVDARACFTQAEPNSSDVNESATQDRDNDPYGLNDKPEVAEGIGVDSRIGELIELDVDFNDEQNRHIRIGDYLDGKRPVVLSFNYSNCPKLCSVQLENMTLALREVAAKSDLRVGDDFQIVSISIDPTEQTSRARQSKEKYTTMYNQPGTEHGWHFLTGDQTEIQLMADICGFRYKYIREQKLYSHPPVFILLSPHGKIVRYIHGLDYDPKTIELALIESAEGKIGSPINILSYGIGCFLFDESTGKYTFQAMAMMRITAAGTVLILMFTLVPYWFFRRGYPPNDEKKNKTGLPVPSGNSG
jgi:protein SCO1/2